MYSASFLLVAAALSVQAQGDNMLTTTRDTATLSLSPSDGRVTLTDGSTVWEMGGNRPDFGYLVVNLTEPESMSVPGKQEYHALGGKGGVPVEWHADSPDALVGTGRLPSVDVTFTMAYRLLADRRLQCRIDLQGADAGKVAEVSFPNAPSVTGSASRLVFPQWLGLLVSPEGEDMSVRRTLWQRPWCMRFIGATQPANGGSQSYIAIVADSLYRSVEIWRQEGRAGFRYLGDRSYVEKASDTRTQRIEFQFLDGDYVEIAKRYRTWAMEQPTWRTLATRERPCRPEVIGGAILFAHVPCDYGTPLAFDTLIPRIQALKDAGIERAIFHLGGWNRAGYDAEYPDILPANEACGGDDGMRRLSKAIDDAGYLCMPHDDIGIISVKAPSYDEKWLARWFDGSLISGGVYRDTQNYITSAAGQAHFAQRNLPEVHRLYPDIHGYLFDVTTSVQPIEDYSSNPPVPKDEDVRRRTEAFRIAKETFAEFVIGESIVDWSIAYNDGAFMAEEGYYHRGDGGWSTDALHGEIVPMWELVYHDSHIAFRDSSTHVNTPMDTEDPLVRYLRVYLKTLRAGTVPPSFFSDDLTLGVIKGYIDQSGADLGGWSQLDGTALVAAVSRISTWLADNVFLQPMTDHEFVEGNFFHERAAFGPDDAQTAVWVNTALEPWSPMHGVTLAPLGFWIEGPGLLAYHALEVGGVRLSAPTLVATKGAREAGSAVQAFRAFGVASAPLPGNDTTLHADIAEPGKTLEIILR